MFYDFDCVIYSLSSREIKHFKSSSQIRIELKLFTGVLTPKPLKTAGPTVLNGRPRRLHLPGLNKGYKWLNHLKWQTPALSHFNSFSHLFVFSGIQV